jgi:hypothetical protein
LRDGSCWGGGGVCAITALQGGGYGVAGGSGSGKGMGAEFKGEMDIYLCE